MKTQIRFCLLFIGLSIGFFSQLKAQTGFNYATPFQTNGSSNVWANSTYTDANNNVYVTGFIFGTVNFNPAGTANLTPTGSVADIFVAKYDVKGNYVWAFHLPSTASAEGLKVTADLQGNIYLISGSTATSGTTNMDPSGNTNNVTLNGSYTNVITKYDGNKLPTDAAFFKWTMPLGKGSGATSLGNYNLVVDKNNYLYVTGEFTGSANFDPVGATTTLTTPPGIYSMFVAKFDASKTPAVSGFFQWAKANSWSVSSGTTYNARCGGRSLGIDAAGNVYVSGSFYAINNPCGTTTQCDFSGGASPSTASFSNTRLSPCTSNDAEYNAYLVKFNSNGTFQWATVPSDVADESGSGMAVDAQGNAYMTGYYGVTTDGTGASLPNNNNTTYFDPSSTTSNTLFSTGNGGMYIAKYNTSGNVQWVKSLPVSTNYAIQPQRLGLDEVGNIYIGGMFNSANVNFDPLGNASSISTAGLNDIFIAKYTNSGAYVSAYRIGGTGQDNLVDLAIDKAGNVLASGYFAGSGVNFNPFGSKTISSTGSNSGFILSLSQINSDYYNWGGASSNAYSTAGNWVNGSVPSSANIAVIPTGSSNNPVQVSSASSLTQLVLQSGSSLNLAAGNISVSDYVYNAAGTISIPIGRNLQAASGTYNSGIINGAGTITSNLLNVATGNIAPGSATAVGILTETGNFNNYSGSLSIKVAGAGYAGKTAGYDQLAVTGTATLAGTLNISAINSYTLTGGLQDTVLTSSGLTGTFSTVTWPAGITTGVVTYNGTSVIISIPFTAPTTQATNVTFSSTTATGATISWTNGSGTARAVFVKAVSSGSAAPVNLTTYTANTTFGSGTQIGSTGWYCVYNGTGTTVSVTGLTTATTYQVAAIDYNGTAGNELYAITTGVGNPGSVTTLSGPTISPTGTLTAFTTTSGTASASQSFTVAGSALSTNITVTAPTGFELSTTSGGTYSTSITLTQSSGAVATTTVYARMAATATGTPSGNITLASTGATTQNLAVTGTILPPTIANSGWTAQTSTTSRDLYSVYFTSATQGWAVGGFGAIVTTTNGGSTWGAQASSTFNNLNAVYFTSATQGWAVGAGAIILATTNGGTTWTAQTSTTSRDLYSVYFTSATQGWAVGGFGAIVTTTNGGSTWGAQASSTFNNLNAVYFTSATQGWAVGTVGTILTTTNGGTTWTAQTSGTTQDLNSVYFTSATQGWAVGTNGTILTTANGGTTWTTQTSGTTLTLASIKFTNATQGWATGNNGIIINTANGGTTWAAQTSGTTNNLSGVFFTSPSNGFAVGAAATVLKYGLSSLTNFNTVSGTASSSQLIPVSASNLTGVVTITASAGFEISASAGGTYTATFNLTPTSGVVNTSVYVRLAATATGSPTGNVTFASAGATTQNVAVTGTVIGPSITLTGTLTAFTACSGTASTSQSFTVSGSTLGTNALTVTPPAGFELSLASNGTYSSSAISLTPVSGSVATTTIYVRMASASGSPTAGNITAASTGATSQTVAVSGTVNAVPTITLGAVNTVFTSSTSFSVPYTATTGTPTQYSISTGTRALAGFTPITNATLGTSPISVTIPASAAGTYDFNLTVNTATCTSVIVPFTLTIAVPSPTIATTGSLSALSTTYGTASSTGTFSVSGSFMTAGILLTAPAGFEVSLNSASGFGSSVTVGAAGTITSTPVYIRLLSTNAANSYSGNVVLTSSGATTVNVATVASTVTKVPITITANGVNKPYGTAISGASGSTAYTITAGSLQNSETISSVTITYGAGAAANDAVNTYTGSVTPGAVIGGNGFSANNYNITYATGNIVVNPFALTITATGPPKAFGSALTAGTSSTNFTAGATVNGETVTGVTLTPNAAGLSASTAVGSPYVVIPSAASGTNGFLASNYNITYVPYNGTVVNATPTISTTGTLSALTTTYGSVSATGTFSVSGINITGGILVTAPTGFEVSLSSSSGFGGSVTVSGTGTIASTPVNIRLLATDAVNSYSGNVVLTSTGATTVNIATTSSTVNKATLTITATSTTKIYGATNPTFAVTYNGFVGTDNAASLAIAPTINTTALTSSPVGTYPITASGAASPNYSISYVAGTLTVTQATLTITASNAIKVYGAVNPTLAVTYTGFVGTDNAANLATAPTITTTAATSSGVGTYPITASGATSVNYSISYVAGSLTVTQAPLTITASNAIKVYGTVNPTLAVTYIGFVGTDNAVSLTTLPTISTTAVTGSAVGTYPITVSAAVSSNYSISYTAGTLTVTPAALTITATNASKIYGAVNPTLAVTYAGFVGTDNALSLTTAPSITTTAVTSSGVGTYPITASGATSPNYSISYSAGTLTVTPAILTVTASNATKVYGSANPTLAVTYAGFLGTDNAASLTTAPSISTTAITGSGVGTYQITASGAASPNYSISYTAGTLTVNPAALTVAATNASKTYGAANPTLTVAYSGFVNGDNAASLNTPPAINTTAVAASPVATYPITASGAVSNNYTISYVPAILTVNPATLTIAANNQSRNYGTANPTLSLTYTGFVNGDNALSLTTQPTVSTTTSTTSLPGTYPVTVGGAASANYTINYTQGLLTVIPLTNANLSNLTVSIGALTPVFTSGITSYSILVVNGVTSVTVTPTVADATATVKVNGATVASGSASGNIAIQVGQNVITTKVTAQDGVTIITYTITVTRAPSSNAGLANLTISNGILSPTFGTGVFNYTATVDNSISTITLTPTLADATATILVNGSPAANNSLTNPINLIVGDNAISVVITAQDGITILTYTIIIHRAAPPQAIYANNILSPNGDGKNDTWVVKDILSYPNNTVTVYDRAGRIVYSKHTYTNDWNGSLRGSPLAEGTYYYVIDLGTGQDAAIKGFITIVRSR